MDRAQFMQELEKLLADISETERQDALDFYNSYFDDAGAENEASVLRELGSPEKVAAIIKADLKGSAGGYEYGEYTEHGYEDARTKERGQMPEKYGEESGTGKRFFRKGNQAVLINGRISIRDEKEPQMVITPAEQSERKEAAFFTGRQLWAATSCPALST